MTHQPCQHAPRWAALALLLCALCGYGLISLAAA
jgi:hypothetical protein